jgi:hypothetical protein
MSWADVSVRPDFQETMASAREKRKMTWRRVTPGNAVSDEWERDFRWSLTNRIAQNARRHGGECSRQRLGVARGATPVDYYFFLLPG